MCYIGVNEGVYMKCKCTACGHTFIDDEEDWRDDEDGNSTLICPSCGSDDVE